MNITTLEQLENFINNVSNYNIAELKQGFNQGESIVLQLDDSNRSRFNKIYKTIAVFSPSNFSKVTRRVDQGSVLYSLLSFKLLLKTYLSRFIQFDEDSIRRDIRFIKYALFLTNSDPTYHNDLSLICYSIMQLIEFNNILKDSPEIELDMTLFGNKFNNHTLSILFILESLMTMKSKNIVNRFFQLVIKTIEEDK
jgi:hypothetical protein